MDVEIPPERTASADFVLAICQTCRRLHRIHRGLEGSLPKGPCGYTLWAKNAAGEEFVTGVCSGTVDVATRKDLVIEAKKWGLFKVHKTDKDDEEQQPC